MKFLILGVIEELKSYRLYNSKQKKVIINKNVVFKENEEWDRYNGDNQ